MATPFVSGSAALLKSRYPSLKNYEIREILRNTSTDLGEAGFDIYTGYGKVNVSKAVLVDREPPAITIISPANTTYNTSSVKLNYSVSDSNSITSVKYSLDGSANVSLSGNTTLYALSNGSHTLVVYASDSANNIGSASAAFSINIIAASESTSVATAFDNTTNLTASYGVGFNETSGNISLDIVTVQETSGTLDITIYTDSPAVQLNQSTGLGPNENAANKYIEFNASPSIAGNLSWAIIKIYYSAADIAGLNESTLKFYRYCPASNSWQAVQKPAPNNITCGSQNITVYDTAINTSSSPHYIYANLSSFSLYAMGGRSNEGPVPPIPFAPLGTLLPLGGSLGAYAYCRRKLKKR